MKHGVNFSFDQLLQTDSPHFNLRVIFFGYAVVNDQTNEVEVIWCKSRWDGYIGEPVALPTIEGAPFSKQNQFVGKCREAARNAYYKERMKEAATQHNAGFVPMASDISYMEESDRFPDVTIDRS